MTIVKLNAQFTCAGGGIAYRGEMIGVDPDTAKNLIRSGAASAVKTEQPAEVTLATKPVADPAALKGFAKLNYLRARIREMGAEPEGRTVVAMTEQLRALGG